MSLIHGMFDHRSGDGGQCGGRTPVTADEWRNYSYAAQASHQHRRLAMAVCEAHSQALSLPATSVRARHVRRGPGFIDEDKLGRIKVQLIIDHCWNRSKK